MRRKRKRSVTFGDDTYKVRSDTIEIPDFAKMDRTSALLWLNRHTYPRGHSRAGNPLRGLGGAITVRTC